MRCELFSIVLALCAFGSDVHALSDLEEFPHEFHMQLLYPRQSTQSSANVLASFFSQALGGPPSAITNSGSTTRPFQVGSDTFPDFLTAANRACDNQHNTCAQMANNKTGSFSVSQCDAQDTSCKAAASAATATTFGNTAQTTTSSAQATLFSSNAEFDFFCDP